MKYNKINEYRKKTLIIVSVAYLIIGICFIVFLFGDQMGISFAFIYERGESFIAFLLMGIAFFNIIIVQKKYRTELKKNILKYEVENNYPQLKYQPDDGIKKEEYENSRLYKVGNTYYSDSLVEGEYCNIKIKMSYINTAIAYHEAGSPIFQGKFFIFETPKRASANIYIFERDCMLETRGKGLKEVNIIDKEFSKKFKVYIEKDLDQKKIYKSLTSDQMRKILEFEKENKGYIRIAFKENKLYMGIFKFIPNKIKIRKKITSEYVRELAVEFKIIDDIKNKLISY